jgi:hypothetical protein
MGWVVNAMPQLFYPPGLARYLLNRRLGGPQDQSEQVQKIRPPLGFDPRTIQLIASCCTDYATLARVPEA